MLDSMSPSTSPSIASSSSFLSAGAENEGESDDTIILQSSPAQRNKDDLTRLAQVDFTDGEIKMVILMGGGGDKVAEKYGAWLTFLSL